MSSSAIWKKHADLFPCYESICLLFLKPPIHSNSDNEPMFSLHQNDFPKVSRHPSCMHGSRNPARKIRYSFKIGKLIIIINPCCNYLLQILLQILLICEGKTIQKVLHLFSESSTSFTPLLSAIISTSVARTVRDNHNLSAVVRSLYSL
jgi:hypothetical protein